MLYSLLISILLIAPMYMVCMALICCLPTTGFLTIHQYVLSIVVSNNQEVSLLSFALTVIILLCMRIVKPFVWSILGRLCSFHAFCTFSCHLWQPFPAPLFPFIEYSLLEISYSPVVDTNGPQALQNPHFPNKQTALRTMAATLFSHGRYCFSSCVHMRI